VAPATWPGIPTARPREGSGKNVYIQTTLYKFMQRLPLEKIESSFEQYGLKISAPTALELLWRAG